MAELADAQDLGSCAFGRGGSSPPSRTKGGLESGSGVAGVVACLNECPFSTPQPGGGDSDLRLFMPNNILRRSVVILAAVGLGRMRYYCTQLTGLQALAPGALF